jgi:hypothetical protein
VHAQCVAGAASQVAVRVASHIIACWVRLAWKRGTSHKPCTEHMRTTRITVLTFAIGRCSLGAILVASSAKGVASILLGDDPPALMRELEDWFPRAGCRRRCGL